MPRIRVWPMLILATLAACRHAANTGNDAPDAAPLALAAYGAQRVVVTPTARVQSADTLGWVQQLGGAAPAARALDTHIAAVLGDRGLGTRWVFPPELERTYERNRSYAADPYQLAVEPLRARSFAAGGRFGEPLSTQLRTMIALQEDTRYVLVPVELRFEAEATGGHAILRAALMDPRAGEAKWVGTLRGTAAANPAGALAGIARRLADLFVAP